MATISVKTVEENAKHRIEIDLDVTEDNYEDLLGALNVGWLALRNEHSKQRLATEAPAKIAEATTMQANLKILAPVDQTVVLRTAQK